MSMAANIWLTKDSLFTCDSSSFELEFKTDLSFVMLRAYSCYEAGAPILRITSLAIALQTINYAVKKGEPTCFDHVCRDADGGPLLRTVAGGHDNAYFCRDALCAVDNSYFEVSQFYLRQFRVKLQKSGAKSPVEGVNWPVTLCDAQSFLTLHHDLDCRFSDRLGVIAPPFHDADRKSVV